MYQKTFLCSDISLLSDLIIQKRRDGMVFGFITTYASVPITTNVVSSNSAQVRCTRYNNI